MSSQIKHLSFDHRYLFSVALIGLLSVSSATAQEKPENPGTEGNGDVVIAPEYKTDIDLTDRANL